MARKTSWKWAPSLLYWLLRTVHAAPELHYTASCNPSTTNNPGQAPWETGCGPSLTTITSILSPGATECTNLVTTSTSTTITKSTTTLTRTSGQSQFTTTVTGIFTDSVILNQPSSSNPRSTITTTRTSGSAAFTTTISTFRHDSSVDEVLSINVPTEPPTHATTTITSVLNPGSPPYSSTSIGKNGTDTVIIGKPQPYSTSTSYIHGGSAKGTTYTSNGQIVIATQVSTTTRTTQLEPGASIYTSTYFGVSSHADTIVVGVSSAYATITSYLHGVNQSATTFTRSGSIHVETPVQTTTVTRTLAPGQSEYTSTSLAGGSVADTVYYGVSQPYITQYSTTTLPPGSPGFVSDYSTSGSTIYQIIGITQAYNSTVVTKTLDPTASAYTSTQTGSGTVSVIYGVPGRYKTVTTTTTLPPGFPGFTRNTATSESTVYQQIGITQPYRITTQTTTLPPGSSPYTSYYTSASIVYVTIAVSQPYISSNTKIALPPGSSGYTTYATSGSYVIKTDAVTQPYVTRTSTSTLPIGSSKYTSTNTGPSTVTIVVGSPALSTQSATTKLTPSASPYTTTYISMCTMTVSYSMQTVTSTLQPGGTPFISTYTTLCTGKNSFSTLYTRTTTLTPGVYPYTSTVYTQCPASNVGAPNRVMSTELVMPQLSIGRAILPTPVHD